MKLLVIGNKGFIGNHAFQFFSALDNFDCWGADVVVDYTTEKYFVLDASTSDFNEIFENGNFDACINCSGAASVPDSLQHPYRDFLLNTHNVIKIVEAIRRHSPQCKFINLSSAAVYGNPLQLPIRETDICQPVSPYGRHKWFAEELCSEYHLYWNVQVCSVRIFSAYGPGLKKQLLWDIYKKSLAGNKVLLFGTGNEERDFIYVTDIVNCLYLILMKGRFDAAIYNIANGEPVKIRDIAHEMLSALHYEGELQFSGEERSGDPTSWQADISKTRELGYTPSFTIKKGINQYIQWLREEKLP